MVTVTADRPKRGIISTFVRTELEARGLISSDSVGSYMSASLLRAVDEAALKRVMSRDFDAEEETLP